MSEFARLLILLRSDMEVTQIQLAKSLGISNQYLCDLENARRLPSVRVVNALCKYLGRGPQGRLVWHRAGAQAHGWEI